MNILITGSSSGIGFSTGVELVKKGCFVYFTVHRYSQVITTVNKLSSLNIGNIGKNYEVFKLDITLESDRNKLFDLDIDCLINNAAIGIGGSILDLNVSKIKDNFEVNVFSTVEMIQTYAASLFLNNKRGRVIVVSSLAGLIPLPFMGSYCATKASLITLMTSLRRELSLVESNLEICLIEPGIYVTGFNEVMIDNKEEISIFGDIYPRITYYQKLLFKIFGKKDLKSISRKIVKATISRKNKFIYRAPFTQVLSAKIYMLLFK